MASSSAEIEQMNQGMIAIPKVIHFIWLGAPLPEDARQLIIDWAQKIRNSGYQISLWTDLATINAPILSKRLIQESIQLNDWRKELPDEDPRYKKIRSLSEQIIHEGRKKGARINYAAISDLLRFLVVHAQGGLYTDTDNFIVEAGEQIGDILVDKKLGARMLRDNNSFLAAVPDSSFVNDVLDYFVKFYDKGMAANPMGIDIREYANLPRYKNFDDSKGFEPEPIDDERLNSLAYWVTQTAYIDWKPHRAEGKWYPADERDSILFFMTLALTGPGIIGRIFMRLYNAADIGSEQAFFQQSAERFLPDVLPGIFDLGLDKKTFIITPDLKVADGQKSTWHQLNYNGPIGFDHSPLYHRNMTAIPKKIHQVLLNNQPDKRVLGRGCDLSKTASKSGYATTIWITGDLETSSDQMTQYRNWLDLELSSPLEAEAKAYVMKQLAHGELTGNERLLCELIISTLILMHEGGLVLPSGYGSWAGFDLGEIRVPLETGVKISSPQSILIISEAGDKVGQTYLPSVMASAPAINTKTQYLEKTLERLLSLIQSDFNQLTALDIQQSLINPLMHETPSVESSSKFRVYRAPVGVFADHLVWIGNSVLFYNTATLAPKLEEQPMLYGLQSNAPKTGENSNAVHRFFQPQANSSGLSSSLPMELSALNLTVKNAVERCKIPGNYTFQCEQSELNRLLAAIIHADLFLMNIPIPNPGKGEADIKDSLRLVLNGLYEIGHFDNGQLPKNWEGQFALNLLSELRGKTIVRDDFIKELGELEIEYNQIYPDEIRTVGDLYG